MSSRILLISNGFQPNYEKAFANGLASHDVDVTLVASERTLTPELLPGVRVLGIRGSQDPRRTKAQKARNLLRYVSDLVRHLRRESYDLVHLTGMFMTPNVLAGCLEWAAYRLTCRRFVMTVHNILPHGRHGAWYRFVHHFVYRLPHLLVVHTQRMKAELVREFKVAPQRIVVMAHGVDSVPGELTVPAGSARLQVLLFGGLNPYKGVDQFLAAAALCPDIPMDIVIAGEARDADYTARVSGLIERLPASQQVVWHRGFIAEDSVKDFFEAADVVALPYRHIDQSGVLFTAFRFGVPLLVTDVGSFRESLPDFAGVVAPSSEPADLARSLHEFMDRRKAFCRERIREHAQALSWPNTVRPLIAAYQELRA